MKHHYTLKNHQLYYFRGCPFCTKVRLALCWMGIKLVLKNIRADPQYKAELIAGGRKKQVPCLRIEKENDEVQWLYESGDIIRYLKSHRAVTGEG